MSYSPSASLVIQNPENLTKDKLKAELRKNGISFDQNENKDYYIRLYRSKVSKPQERRQRSEFSSDEELVRRSPRFGSKKQTSKMASKTSYMASVSQMTDEELAEELRAFGEEPGPVTDSTRGVYQRKLAKLMAEKTKASSMSRQQESTDYATDKLGEWSSHSSEGDTDPEAEQEEEEEAGVVEEPPPMRLRSTAKTQHVAYESYSTPTRRVESTYLLKKPKDGSPKAAATGRGDQSSHKTQRDSRPHPQAPRCPPAKTPQPTAPQPGSMWNSVLSIALLLIMFAVTFLAYDHYTSEDSFVSQFVTYLRQLGVVKYGQ